MGFVPGNVLCTVVEIASLRFAKLYRYVLFQHRDFGIAIGKLPAACSSSRIFVWPAKASIE